MRRTLAAVLAAPLALSTILALATTTPSAADPGPVPRTPVAGLVAQQHADRALRRVTDLVRPASALARAGIGSATPATRRADATLAMVDLFRSLPDLDPTERKQARALMARPTDGTHDGPGDGYTVPAQRRCSGNFCLHWVPTTADAPTNDSWVDTSLKTMRQVWQLEVDKLGYRQPLTDGQRGGSPQFDVYLKELGSRGLYGYCVPETHEAGAKWHASGYCVLDNDFARSQYHTAPRNSLRVTAAHEFFHAVQFAYDRGEDAWFMEATATWMEERFADDVNDNRQYLPYGQVRRPASSLDRYSNFGYNQYGNWPFIEYLSDHFGERIVRRIWTSAAADPGGTHRYSTKALRNVLRQHGGFKNVFAAYAAANTIPGKSYPEGRHWPSAAISHSWMLSKDRGNRTAEADFKIRHLSSRNTVVRPASGTTHRAWRLRLRVSGPPHGSSPTAYVIVRRVHGHALRRPVPLNRSGNGTVDVVFGSSRVKSVTVTLANASTRTTCWQQTGYSCMGRPRDDAMPYRLRATVFHR